MHFADIFHGFNKIETSNNINLNRLIQACKFIGCYRIYEHTSYNVEYVYSWKTLLYKYSTSLVMMTIGGRVEGGYFLCVLIRVMMRRNPLMALMGI